MTQDKLPTPIDTYKFCPKCGSSLNRAGDNALKCTGCGYMLFVNASPASGAVILDDQNRVLLVRRKFEPYKDTWQIPGGFMTPGETAKEAVVREIREELDVEISAKEVVATLSMTYPYGGMELPLLCIYSAASIVSGTPTPHDDVAEIKFFDKASLKELDMTTEAQREMLNEYLK